MGYLKNALDSWTVKLFGQFTVTLKDDVLQRIDLQALAEHYGAKFNSANSSACPIHKGDNPNGFHLYGDNGRLDRWHCFTNCPTDKNDGNAIDLLMAVENIDFKEALARLVKQAGLDTDQPRQPDRTVAAPKPAPRPAAIRQTNEPHPQWVKRAEEFVTYAKRTLWSDAGQPVVKWLIEQRGLTETTIRDADLGVNLTDVYDLPAKWGGESDAKKIYCSMGVIIPHRIDGHLRFVNVRRPLPGEDTLTKAMGKSVTFAIAEKYAGPRGGRRGLYGLDQMKRQPIALMTEGEFDCLLARQLVGEIADVVTIGGARMKLDVRGAAALLSASIILSTYDEDETGDKGRAYLSSVSDRVETLRVPDHDLTDYWQHGGPLGAWLADQIMRRFERLIAGIDEDAQPDTFVRWLGLYQRARQMCRPDITRYTGDRELMAELVKIGFRLLNVD